MKITNDVNVNIIINTCLHTDNLWHLITIIGDVISNARKRPITAGNSKEFSVSNSLSPNLENIESFPAAHLLDMQVPRHRMIRALPHCSLSGSRAEWPLQGHSGWRLSLNTLALWRSVHLWALSCETLGPHGAGTPFGSRSTGSRSRSCHWSGGELREKVIPAWLEICDESAMSLSHFCFDCCHHCQNNHIKFREASSKSRSLLSDDHIQPVLHAPSRKLPPRPSSPPPGFVGLYSHHPHTSAQSSNQPHDGAPNVGGQVAHTPGPTCVRRNANNNHIAFHCCNTSRRLQYIRFSRARSCSKTANRSICLHASNNKSSSATSRATSNQICTGSLGHTSSDVGVTSANNWHCCRNSASQIARPQQCRSPTAGYSCAQCAVTTTTAAATTSHSYSNSNSNAINTAHNTANSSH